MARELYEESAQRRVEQVIADIESKTSAEVIVALRPSSGHYRHSDYLAGAGLAFVSLLVFLFHPLPMRVDVYAAEFVVAFALGAIVCAWTPPLRRALTSKRLLEDSVKRAARAAFVELGVSRTRARTGLLVYISQFERRIELVPDTGIDPAALGKPWQKARAELASVLDDPAPTDKLVSALAALGDALARALPRAADDVDELPNQMST